MTEREKLVRLAQNEYFLPSFDKYIARLAATSTPKNVLDRIPAVYQRGKAYIPYVSRVGSKPNFSQLTVEARSLPYLDVDDGQVGSLYKILFETYFRIDGRAADRRIVKKHPRERIREMQDNETKRAITYILREAFHQGITRYLESTNSDTVYRRTEPGACKTCLKLFTVKGIPRLFRLRDLIKNGSNIGREKPKPVVGQVHPNCRCRPPALLAPWMYIGKNGKVLVNHTKLDSILDEQQPTKNASAT